MVDMCLLQHLENKWNPVFCDKKKYKDKKNKNKYNINLQYLNPKTG